MLGENFSSLKITEDWTRVTRDDDVISQTQRNAAINAADDQRIEKVAYYEV